MATHTIIRAGKLQTGVSERSKVNPNDSFSFSLEEVQFQRCGGHVTVKWVELAVAVAMM